MGVTNGRIERTKSDFFRELYKPMATKDLRDQISFPKYRERAGQACGSPVLTAQPSQLATSAAVVVLVGAAVGTSLSKTGPVNPTDSSIEFIPNDRSILVQS